jgi:cytochrome c-type biogenesis protein CcmH
MALKAMHPPLQIEQMLDARIAELGAAGVGMAGAQAGGPGLGDAAAGPAPMASGAAAQGGAGRAEAASAPGPDVTVNISIAPSLKARLTREAPLFVFARDPGAQGPPLAAKRLTSASIGTQVHLSAADSMMPGRVLQSGHTVSITARVSFSGQPLPAAGDLYGELTYDVGHDGARELVIDRVAD